MFTWLILAVGAVGVVVAKDAALAQSSSGSSRSTWDIILACLATIIACTWTVQHSNVPTRNASDFLITVKRITRWLVTLMAPEIATFLAVDELKMAVNIVAACNSAEAANSNPDKQTNIAAIRPIQRSVGLTVDLHEVKLHPVQDKWSVAQAYCVLMGGLALQTEDGWIYTVSPSNISNFIQAGIISCRNFRDRDIKDKAKADSFAKTFTLLQSTWSVINILARVIYGLPVSLVELTTVSYVACAVFTYAFWWHKPKDMMTPIIMYLPYSRSTLPPQVQTLTDSTSTGWTHLRVVAKEESLFALPNIYHDWRRHAIDEPARKPEHAQGNSSPTHMTTRAEALVDAVGVFIALLFCGIHIAAWNFEFPTYAEKITWRVFAVTAIAMVCIVYMVCQMPPVMRWLDKRRHRLPSFLKKIADAEMSLTPFEMLVAGAAVIIYFIVRLGIVALILSSLRSLPPDAYKAVDWQAAIPHI